MSVTINLNPAQSMLLAAVITTMHASIEWAAVAEKTGCDTPKKARDYWGSIRKKLITIITQGDKPSISLNDSQHELVGAVFDTLQTGAGIDWDGVGAKTGCDTAEKARDNWYTVRKLLMARVNLSVTATPKKRTAGEDAGAEETPAKKAKGTAKRSKKAKKADVTHEVEVSDAGVKAEQKDGKDFT